MDTEQSFNSFYLSVCDYLRKNNLSRDVCDRMVKCATDEDRVRLFVDLVKVPLDVKVDYEGKDDEIAAGDISNKGGKLKENLKLVNKAISLCSHPAPSNEINLPIPQIVEEISSVIFEAITSGKTDEFDQLGRKYFQRARILYELGEYIFAVNDVIRSLRISVIPSNIPELLVLSGKCFYFLQDLETTEKCLQKALELLRSSEIIRKEDKASLTIEIVSILKKIKESVKITTSNGCLSQSLSTPVVPEVSYGQNEELQQASCAIQLKVSEDKGRHLIANQNIKPGDILIVDDAYSWILSEAKYSTHCLYCCTRIVAPIPCYICSNVQFCSEECRHLSWTKFHQYECKYLNIINKPDIGSMALLALRIVTMTPQCILFDEEEPSKSLRSFDSGSYNTVFGQVTNSQLRPGGDLLKRTTVAIYLLKCLELSGYFINNGLNEDGMKIKICSLLLRHLQSCSCNAYEINEVEYVNDDNMTDIKTEVVGGAVYPTVSLSNHSCFMNVVRHSYGKFCVVTAIRNIKSGEEILDNYGYYFECTESADRIDSLKRQYFFDCRCIACNLDWPLFQTVRSKPVLYKCFHCGDDLNSKFNDWRKCPNCKTDLKKLGKRLESLKTDYNVVVKQVSIPNIQVTIPVILKYFLELENYITHPNLEFMYVQQIFKSCLSLKGNKYKSE